MPSTPAPLVAGTVVTGRYRLLRQVGSPSSTLWQAQDDVLARPVAIRSLPVEPGSERVLDAARRAGVVPHRTLTRAYDVVDEPDLRLVVREWVAGEPLDAVVAEAPLSGDRAIVVVGQVAEALAAAADYGVHHGRLHPAHVLLTPDGDIRVTDAATAAALAGEPAGDDTDDVRALGAVLYFAVTGRWPGPDRLDLPPAPVEEGRLCSPRQVRAGVPRDLDRLVQDCLVPGPTTPASAAELARRLATLHQLDEPAEQLLAPPPDPPPHPGHRTRIPMVAAAGVGVVLIGVVLVAALTGGSAVGNFPPLREHHPATTSHAATRTTSTSTTSAGPSAAGVPIALSSATSFDPPPGDGSEEQSQTHNAIDGNPATAWFTENYTRADFGGLKSGVGLLLDAGSAVAPTRVTITFTAPGASYQLRAADATSSTTAGYALEGQATATSATSSVAVTDRTPHRYWLIWLTNLPPLGSGFKAGIAEVALSR